MRHIHAALGLIAIALTLAAPRALADESAAYAAYTEGRYLTALDLAKKEAEAGSR